MIIVVFVRLRHLCEYFLYVHCIFSQAAPPKMLAAALAKKMTEAQADEVEKATRERFRRKVKMR